MRPVYPWSAVVGQDALKHALLLCAIDPAIGGVLLSGPRGVAKTTLARALGELIDGPFVELPLGATDDRVTGTLDLGSALQDSKVVFSPGLLARANDGVLYVDEVNLLPDMLVDLLLDAAASGQNVVERDGISHAHAARFVLVGTMNPDEGELRPQLTDRFGLSVDAHAALTSDERIEIVRRRLAFDADAASFRTRHAEAQAELQRRCAAARTRASKIPLDGPALARVSELCAAANVEGVRADLAMLRAARANAAWEGRDTITVEDVECVAELALAHRRQSMPEPPRGGGAPPPSSEKSGGGGSSSKTRDQGALAPVPVASAVAPTLPAWLTDSPARRAERRRRGAASVDASRGRRARDASAGSIDWFATLARRTGPLTREQLRHRARRAPNMQHWVVAIDCSASMLRSGALAAAKGVAQAIERDARRVGAHVSLLSFSGVAARVEAGAEARRTTRQRALDELGGAGATPLCDAVASAVALAKRRPFDESDAGRRIMLLTDGRTRERVAPTASDADVIVVDCERGPVRLGRARTLANHLGARYVHVDALGGAPATARSALNRDSSEEPSRHAADPARHLALRD